MKNKLFLVALVTLIAASCSKNSETLVPTINQESLEKKGPKARPFKGSLAYSFAPNEDLPCDCGDYYPVGTFQGTGNLSHMGNSYSQIKPCVSPLIEDGNQIGEFVGVECAYFVAANGDSVYLYTHPYNLYYTPVGAVGTATVDFVGGTGRFTNATGTFTGKVTVGATGATFTGLSGTISY